MSTNLFSRLKRMLPDSPVLVGLVTAHHDDDTSTLLLPLQQGQQGYSGPIETGSLIRARGTFVPVGENAFVRDGVIETRAPSGTAQPIVIGKVVDIPDALAFAGPIGNQTLTVGTPFSLALAPLWTGGLAPKSWTLSAGTLPSGIALDAAGVLSGTATSSSGSPFTGLVVRVTDAGGAVVDSNSFSLTVGESYTAAGVTFYTSSPGAGGSPVSATQTNFIWEYNDEFDCGVFSAAGTVTLSKGTGFITSVYLRHGGTGLNSVTVSVYSETGGSGTLLATQTYTGLGYTLSGSDPEGWHNSTLTFSGVGKSVVIAGAFQYYLYSLVMGG